MKRLSRVFVLACVWLGFASSPMLASHSFDNNGIVACLDGALWNGEPTGASALNLLFHAQVFLNPNVPPAIQGNTHVYTSIGEDFQMEVQWSIGSVVVGQPVQVSSSDVVDTTNGSEGSADIVVVGDCLLFSCGNGIVDPGEQCDDGNTDDGDCCSSACQMPTGCSTAVGKALFMSKEKVAGKEKLVAKLLKGPALMQSDFGDPLAGGGTEYNLCVWDDAGNLVGTYEVDRAGDLCSGGSDDCWKPVGKAPPDGKGFKYKDKDGASDGIQKVIIKGGAAGKSKALIKGKGSGLPAVAAALQGSTSVTLQLHGSDAAACLETTLTDIKKADADFFKAK